MNEQANSALLEEHEVLFLDFLGFASAVKHWDDDRMARLISVLVNIAGAQSAFYIKGQAQSDGSYKITVLPEMTTFSDHIVMSCQRPAKPDEAGGKVWEFGANVWGGTGCRRVRHLPT